MYELRDYIDENGNRRFARWFEKLDAPAAARVTMALTRMEQGNFSSAKGVGGGVYEYKIDFGPGYRIYFGKDYQDYVDMAEGDFMFVPPLIPHLEANMSTTEELWWLACRTPD